MKRQIPLTLIKKLEPIAPRWARLLKKYDNKLPQQLLTLPNEGGCEKINLHYSSCCIVGEAHLFPRTGGEDATMLDEYDNCEKCVDFSNLLYYQYGSAEFVEKLQEFITHWNKEHKDQDWI